MPRYVGLVVHGIGEQECGSQLKDVGVALAGLIQRSKLDPEVSLRVSPAQEPGPAWAEISLRDGHTVRLEEVWWARCFTPPSVQRAIGFWVGAWLRDPLGFVRGTFRPLRQWWDVIFLQRFIVEVVAYAALVLFLPLAAIVWFLSVNPIRRFLPKAVQSAYEIAANVLTRHVGDLSVYLDDAWEASRIQEVFACRLKAISDQPADERFIIAHSMGAVVTYEGLMRAACGGAERVPVNFIAVGAALNRARRMVAPEEAHRLEGPLPRWVKLTYIAARHDPATLGALDRPEKWALNPIETLEVVNQEDIFSDHTTYWGNAEEVMAPILGIISGGHLSLDLRKSYRRLRVTVLAALKGIAWLLPAAVFVWMATTGWSSAFAAWAYGKPLLQTPVRLITQSPQTATTGASPATPAVRMADGPGSLMMAALPGVPLLVGQQEGVIAVDAESGGEIDGERTVTVGESFEVTIVIEGAPLPYVGYRYLLTWDPKSIAMEDSTGLATNGLSGCTGPEPIGSEVSGGCSAGRTTEQGAVASIRLHCRVEGKTSLDLVGLDQEPDRGTTLLVRGRTDGGYGAIPSNTALRGADIACSQASTPTESPTETPTPMLTLEIPTPTPSPTPTARDVTPTPTVTPPPKSNGKGPWDQPNDFLDVFGGRWTLAHLALPLLASSYVAVAVGVVYNLVVKTAWDIWDRRTKYTPARPAEGEPPPGPDEEHQAQS